MAKTALPMQGAWVRSLVRELDPTCHNCLYGFSFFKIPYISEMTLFCVIFCTSLSDLFHLA